MRVSVKLADVPACSFVMCMYEIKSWTYNIFFSFPPLLHPNPICLLQWWSCCPSFNLTHLADTLLHNFVPYRPLSAVSSQMYLKNWILSHLFKLSMIQPCLHIPFKSNLSKASIARQVQRKKPRHSHYSSTQSTPSELAMVGRNKSTGLRARSSLLVTASLHILSDVVHIPSLQTLAMAIFNRT